MERNELLGLTEREVAERRQRGEGENGGKRITKRRSQIVKDNVLTLFNFLNFLIAGLLFCGGCLLQHALYCNRHSKYHHWNCAGI